MAGVLVWLAGTGSAKADDVIRLGGPSTDAKTMTLGFDGQVDTELMRGGRGVAVGPRGGFAVGGPRGGFAVGPRGGFVASRGFFGRGFAGNRGFFVNRGFVGRGFVGRGFVGFGSPWWGGGWLT